MILYHENEIHVLQPFLMLFIYLFIFRIKHQGRQTLADALHYVSGAAQVHYCNWLMRQNVFLKIIQEKAKHGAH